MKQSIFKVGFILTGVLAFDLQVFAEVRLAPIFADNMVLQRDMQVPVWGTAAKGEKVTVSFAGQEKSAVAGDDGKWMLKLDPLKVSKEPQAMFISGSISNLKSQISNVLVGEVWLCSGQSNMGMTVLDSLNPAEEISSANHPTIRLLRSDKNWGWHPCSPESVKDFSAVGYFFGRELNKNLDIPIGLICASVGATAIEQWTPLSAFEKDPEFSSLVRDYKKALGEIQEKRKKAEEEGAAWDKDQRPTTQTDPGDKGFEKGYAKPDFDDSAWKTMELPKNFESELDMEIDGAVWFRKEVDIPEKWKGKELHIALGPVDDFDVTYFSGVKVGAIGIETPRFHSVMRNYTVPADIVKAGKNVIAVRVFDHFASGGFPGSRLMMRIYAGDEYDDISLAGQWRYNVELKLDPKSIKWPTKPFASLGVPNLASLYSRIGTLVPYGIRGAIWYQGENNADGLGQYQKLHKLMINAWRAEWKQGDFPFLIVQLANLGNPCDFQEDCPWALLREEQFLVADSFPNCGIATAIDIGDAVDIHPKNKQDVGKRLALVALKKVYGRNLECYGPVYESMSVENGRIRIKFKPLGSGLIHKGDELGGFAIAGADGKYVQAKSEIDGDSVVVWSDKIEKPLNVRYGWAKNPERANLYNQAGLPAFPFRTDN